MEGIVLITYAEAKENFENIKIEEIDDDVYGFIINNTFMPVWLEGTDEYLKYEGKYDCWLKEELI